MATDIFGASPQTDLRRRWALLQLQQAQDTSPVKHPLQAVARAMQGAFGGYAGYQAEQENKAGADKMFDAVLGSGSPNPALERVQPAMSEAQPSGDPASAIAKIESGGAYDKLGPVINRGSMVGDRAYGKYQVMGSNVGPWTEKYLGQRLTPDQFVQNPQAQDAVFKGEFGRLSQRHGPEGAARAWFAGEGGMNKPNRTDQLGTSVAAYGQKFTRAMGPQMASLGNGMPANDTPAPPAGPQMAQAAPPQPVRSQPQVPPEVREQINRLRAIGTPQANQAAWGLAIQYLKPSDRFEEVRDASGRVVGQRNALTGEKKADPTRAEYHYTKQDDGSVVAVNKNDPNDVKFIEPKGGSRRLVDFEAAKKYATTKSEADAKRDVAKPDQDKQQQKVASIVIQDIDRALKEMDNATLPTTGAAGAALSHIGGTAARNVAALVDTVKANAGFEEITKMRQASPTGAALGNVTEKELALLQATVGNLEQSQTETQFRDNLRRVKNTYLDIIHGPGNGPREKLQFEQPANNDPLGIRR
jgi:hypothetical protein